MLSPCMNPTEGFKPKNATGFKFVIWLPLLRFIQGLRFCPLNLIFSEVARGLFLAPQKAHEKCGLAIREEEGETELLLCLWNALGKVQRKICRILLRSFHITYNVPSMLKTRGRMVTDR